MRWTDSIKEATGVNLREPSRVEDRIRDVIHSYGASFTAHSTHTHSYPVLIHMSFLTGVSAKSSKEKENASSSPTEISPPHTENSRVKYMLFLLFRVEISYLT